MTSFGSEIAKYSQDMSYAFSTIDCSFVVLIHNIWDAYSDLDNGPCNASLEETIKCISIVIHCKPFCLGTQLTIFSFQSMLRTNFTGSYWLYLSMIGRL